jgi:hypothetical protein
VSGERLDALVHAARAIVDEDRERGPLGWCWHVAVAEVEDAPDEGVPRQMTTSHVFVLRRAETEERIAGQEEWQHRTTLQLGTGQLAVDPLRRLGCGRHDHDHGGRSVDGVAHHGRPLAAVDDPGIGPDRNAVLGEPRDELLDVGRVGTAVRDEGVSRHRRAR